MSEKGTISGKTVCAMDICSRKYRSLGYYEDHGTIWGIGGIMRLENCIVCPTLSRIVPGSALGFSTEMGASILACTESGLHLNRRHILRRVATPMTLD